MIQAGTILGNRYEIIRHIGSGGMADVYQARCHKLNRYVAVKVLREEFNEDEEFVQRFLAEAQATAGLLHPNIVTIYDAGEDMGFRYIVMELCEGTTLKRYIRRYGRLSVRETVDIARQIALGLQAAHNQGIVHRDIKPQNILISESGKIKIADFGIARAATGNTNTPNLMGSVHYLSPEQARGRVADKRSDMYSLGITMFEMATGKVPFDGENSVSIALMHLQDAITPPRCFFPDIPVSLENIILKATMKHTAERYQNAQELIDDLDKVFQFPDGEYVAIRPDLDESPTIMRDHDTLEAIQTTVKEKNTEKDTYPSTEGKNPPLIDEEDYDDYDDYDEEDEEDSMQPAMRRMIYVITAAGGIMLAMILIYLIVSTLGIWRLPGKKDVTDSTGTSTEAVSTEDTKVIMPNVLKQKRAYAKQTMEKAGLQVKFIYDDTVEEEDDANLIVVEQQYKSGEKLEKDTLVKLTLAVDPASTTESKRVEVPPLVNETEESARKILEEAGLEVTLLYANSDTVKEGYIIKQNPQAGTEVDRGFAITITVSKGVSQVRVPHLTGLSTQAAKEQLNNMGLELGQVTSDYNGSVGVGEVFRQGIEAGTMVSKGTSVDVVISLGEHISYHYEGEVYIQDSPFAEGESGSVKLVLVQNGKKYNLFEKNDVTSSRFPLHLIFEGKNEGDAEVIMYVNGNEYSRESVQLNAVED